MLSHLFFKLFRGMDLVAISTADNGFTITMDNGEKFYTIRGEVVDGKIQVIENSAFSLR